MMMHNHCNVNNIEVSHRRNITKTDQFNLKYLNINSIKHKLFEIENDIHRTNKIIQFIALTETRILPDEADLYNIPNYKSYHSCRDDGHGGAALYVHSSLDSCLVESDVLFKVNFVIVKIPPLKVSIAVVYKKPTVSSNKFLTVLAHIISKANKLILVGDSNINIQNQCVKVTEYCSLIDSLGHRLLNSSDKKYATRINTHNNARQTKSATIDHVVSNCYNFIFNICINDTHLSDHHELFLSFRDVSNTAINFMKFDRHFPIKKLDIPNFKRIITRELSLYKPNNINCLLRLIECTKNRCIRSRNIYKTINPHKLWVNNELTSLINERNRYHKLLKQNPNNEYLKHKYAECCNLTRAKNNKIRREYNSSKLNQFISKPRQLWKCFNEIIHNKPKIMNEIKTISKMDGTVSYNQLEIANTLNSYFCKIGRELFLNIPHINPEHTTLIPNNSHTMALFPVTYDEIKNIILKTKSNSNLNNILSINYVKECQDILIIPLTDHINDCLNAGKFPDALKKARIIPIFKNGDVLSPANYRPISILDDFSKIIEQCVLNRLTSFMKKHNLISAFQFGFQKHSGTLSAASCLLDTIRFSLDASNKAICSGIFIDVTKAFDSISHELLMKKLYRHGIRGKSFDLIESFLTNRTQYVSLNNTNSSPMNIEFGTPQGSTLGPVLFILYLNDITKLKLHGKIILFADDAALIYSACDVIELNQQMNEDVATLSHWFESNKLTLNRKKTKCMIFTKSSISKNINLMYTLLAIPLNKLSRLNILA